MLNLIGQGSIEEGMLGVLAFKKGLFAGVLDAGAGKVFLQGTRLASFMQNVEQVAAAMVPDDAEEAGASGFREAAAATIAANAVAQADEDAGAPASSDVVKQPNGDGGAAGSGFTPLTAVVADPWADLLQAGAAMLHSLATQRQPGAASPIRVEVDPVSGQPSLRLPMPEPALLQQLAKALQPWLKV